MRRPVAVACSMITGAALIVLPVAHAQAAQNYQVRIWGSVELNDDEGWLSDDEHRTVDFDQTVTIGDVRTADRVTFSACVGDEVRAELRVLVEQVGSAQVASVEAALYEGASCENQDLDGKLTTRMTTNSATEGTGAHSVRYFKVTNREEDVPGDYGDFTLRMDTSPV